MFVVLFSLIIRLLIVMFDEFLVSNSNILDNYQKLRAQQSLENTILSDVAKLVSYQLSFSQKLLLFASHFKNKYPTSCKTLCRVKSQLDKNIKTEDGLKYLDMICYLKQLVFKWIGEVDQSEEASMEEIHEFYNKVLEQRNNIFLRFRLRFQNILMFQINKKGTRKVEKSKNLDFKDSNNVNLIFKEFGSKKSIDEINEIEKELLNTMKELIIYKCDMEFKTMLDTDLIKNPPIDILRESPIYNQFQKYKSINKFLIKKDIIETNLKIDNLWKMILSTISSFDIQNLGFQDNSQNESNNIESQFLLFKINFLENIYQSFSKFYDEFDISIIQNFYSKEYDIYKNINNNINNTTNIINDSELFHQDIELAIKNEIVKQNQFKDNIESFKFEQEVQNIVINNGDIDALKDNISKLSKNIHEIKEQVTEQISQAIQEFQTKISPIKIPLLHENDYANCLYQTFQKHQQHLFKLKRVEYLRKCKEELKRHNQTNREKLSKRSKILCPKCHLHKREVILIECGHTFCESCIYNTQENELKCPICLKSTTKESIHRIQWN